LVARPIGCDNPLISNLVGSRQYLHPNRHDEVNHRMQLMNHAAKGMLPQRPRCRPPAGDTIGHWLALRTGHNWPILGNSDPFFRNNRVASALRWFV
jgi:hypothetical protein